MCGAIKVSRGYIHFPTRWTSLLSKRIPLAKFTSSTKQTKQFLTQSGDFNLNGDDINMAYAQKSHTSIIPHCINILSKTGLFKCRQSGQSFLVSMFIMSVCLSCLLRMKTSSKVWFRIAGIEILKRLPKPPIIQFKLQGLNSTAQLNLSEVVGSKASGQVNIVEPPHKCQGLN